MTELMRFDNYQKTSSMNKKAELQGKGKGQFIRKGIVGDWINHFQDKTVREWDMMINQEFDKTGIQDNKILELVKLQGSEMEYCASGAGMLPGEFWQIVEGLQAFFLFLFLTFPY